MTGNEVTFLIAQMVVTAGAIIFGSYLSKKGENTATKEDIKEITDKIEAVKHDYARELESLKASIGNQLFIHQKRYENEFNILAKISGALVVCRDATLVLRPTGYYKDPDETDDQRKTRLLGEYWQAGRALYQLREKWRPFFPGALYKKLQEFDSLAWKEVIQFKHGQIPGDKVQKFWADAEDNSTALIALTDEACELIGSRVKEWEKIKLDR